MLVFRNLIVGCRDLDAAREELWGVDSVRVNRVDGGKDVECDEIRKYEHMSMLLEKRGGF